MRLFTCESCKGVLFFENTRCMTCNQPIGYCAEAARLVPLPEEGQVGGEPARVEVTLPGGKREAFSRCKNFIEHATCNWLVKVSDNQPYCSSCQLTEIIPDLSDPQNRQAWGEVESAKRRLLYALRALRLPVVPKTVDPVVGLSFRFMHGSEEAPVTTGHADGLVTLNVAEADAAFRENMREKLGEAYRTVLGHLRHEIGHYYWDRLVRDGGHLEAFRALFGDERESYQAAIERHYEQGPPASWEGSHISAYATMHPWEDWAETWAHYLHMLDTLETAKSHGLAVRLPGDAEHVSTDDLAFNDFEGLMSSWHAVTIALNSLSRSMGLKDAYPFVLGEPAGDKLRFIHDLVQHAAGKPFATPSRAGSEEAIGEVTSGDGQAAEPAASGDAAAHPVSAPAQQP